MRAAASGTMRRMAHAKKKKQKIKKKDDSKVKTEASEVVTAAPYCHFSVEDVCNYYRKEMKMYPEVPRSLRAHLIDGKALQRLTIEHLLSIGVDRLGLACKVLDIRDSYRRPKKKKDGGKRSLAQWKIIENGFDFFLEWTDPEMGTMRSRALVKYDANQDLAQDTEGMTFSVPDDDRSKQQPMKQLVAVIEKMKNMRWRINVIDRPVVFFHSNITVTDINLQMETFSVDGSIRFYWYDPNLLSSGMAVQGVGENEGDVVPVIFTSMDWLPVNKDELFQNSVPNSCTVDEVQMVYNNNTKVILIEYKFTCEIFEEMELHRFPYDRQFLQVQLKVNFDDWRITGTVRKSWLIPNDFSRSCIVQLAPRIHTQYELFEPWVDTIEQEENSYVLIGIRVQRYQSYFATNMIFPLFLITSLSLTALRIPPDEIADRVATILTLLLTTVAFKFILASELPPMSYMTYIDKYFVFIYLWHCGMTSESILVFGEQKDMEDDEAATRIDDIVFWAAMSVWLFLHLLLAIMVQFEYLYKPWEDVMRENAQGLNEVKTKESTLGATGVKSLVEGLLDGGGETSPSDRFEEKGQESQVFGQLTPNRAHFNLPGIGGGRALNTSNQMLRSPSTSFPGGGGGGLSSRSHASQHSSHNAASALMMNSPHAAANSQGGNMQHFSPGMHPHMVPNIIHENGGGGVGAMPHQQQQQQLMQPSQQYSPGQTLKPADTMSDDENSYSSDVKSSGEEERPSPQSSPPFRPQQASARSQVGATLGRLERNNGREAEFREAEEDVQSAYTAGTGRRSNRSSPVGAFQAKQKRGDRKAQAAPRRIVRIPPMRQQESQGEQGVQATSSSTPSQSKNQVLPSARRRATQSKRNNRRRKNARMASITTGTNAARNQL